MNRESVEVVVIGAGAAGMAAATRMAGMGLQVVLLDEQGSPGGQIYRGITLAPLSRRDLLGPDYAHGNQLAQALASSSVRYEKGASVWQVTREHQVSYLREGRLYTLDAKVWCWRPAPWSGRFRLPAGPCPG
ncbi:FAD-dependent oxidoreductase [Pseudomonas sp. VI4.1]|uniref:FAD-dependent oxidoreductase n=1 Tax=Pseudomonas sp. VI4.1 TaxID=1941346 RepID=UPI0021144711|nr:FAD-dependent oxidoreductase [Pseudomonas sp. VI4.1]